MKKQTTCRLFIVLILVMLAGSMANAQPLSGYADYEIYSIADTKPTSKAKSKSILKPSPQCHK